MPKQKTYKAPTRQQKLRVQIENAIHAAMSYSGMNQSELCDALGMCRSTLFARVRNPDTFSLGELRTIAMLSGNDYSTFLSELVR